MLLAFGSLGTRLDAQDYHAVEGSSMAGSLGIGNNPASIVNTPYPWDLDLISLQLQYGTNFISIFNESFLPPYGKGLLEGSNASGKRFGDMDFNLNLLNGRIALNRLQAVGFGLNLRASGHAQASPYNYVDTIMNPTGFFNSNQGNTNYNGYFTGTSWVEAFLTYSQTIFEDNAGRLNAGFTVKATRGLAAGVAELNNAEVLQGSNGTTNNYTVTNGSAHYGYSYNFDDWQNNKSSYGNLRNFLITDTRGGFNFDIGAEWLIKPRGISIDNYRDDYFDYEWKIGLSFLDLGHNQFIYGSQSHYFTSTAANVTDSVLDQKFNDLHNFNQYNDSLSTIVNGFNSISQGKFRILNPARAVLNIDRPLGYDFYLNLNLSINLGQILSGHDAYDQELNLLTVTPRWETNWWGVYMPFQYNVEHQFLVGGALKAGPLLIGFHNWANIFSRNKMQNGGGYLALVIKPFSKITPKKSDKRLECPHI